MWKRKKRRESETGVSAASEVCPRGAAAAGIGQAHCTALNGSGVRHHCVPYQPRETPAVSETISFTLRRGGRRRRSRPQAEQLEIAVDGWTPGNS